MSERGEDPESARLAALKEFGNVTLTRDSIRACDAITASKRLTRSSATSGSPCARCGAPKDSPLRLS
jgi:hypothetical protein